MTFQALHACEFVWPTVCSLFCGQQSNPFKMLGLCVMGWAGMKIAMYCSSTNLCNFVISVLILGSILHACRILLRDISDPLHTKLHSSWHHNLSITMDLKPDAVFQNKLTGSTCLTFSKTDPQDQIKRGSFWLHTNIGLGKLLFCKPVVTPSEIACVQ